MKLDKADQLFSYWIRTRDNWTCQRCSRSYRPPTQALHCSHFVGRGKENTRYMPENCDALCYGCHRYFTAQPHEHRAWQIAKKGEEVVEKIELASRMYKKKDRGLEAIYWRDRLKKDYGIIK